MSYASSFAIFIWSISQDPKASCDLNDNDDDPMPRDTDPDNW